ncbi:MAG: PKD domain-containing protein [Campylobacterota bacterium]|nr:PKD domain-containing protein [Campylobacterota bacterium]
MKKVSNVLKIFSFLILFTLNLSAADVTCQECIDDANSKCNLNATKCEAYTSCYWDDGGFFGSNECRDMECGDINSESECDGSSIGCGWKDNLLGVGGNCEVAIVNNPPTADAGSDQSADEGTDVTLDGSGSSDSDGTIASYSWTDGSSTWTGVNPTIIPNLAVGDHTITLTVTDNDGATATDTVTVSIIEVPNEPPIANAGEDQRYPIGSDVTLDGSASSDSDGTISYSWTDGSSTWTGESPTISGLPKGRHVITLTVTDNDGATATDTVEITLHIVLEKPEADAGDDQSITLAEGETDTDVTLDGSGSTDVDGTIVSYSWTDGATTWTGVNPTIIGLTEGSHEFQLRVTDNDDLESDVDTVIILIISPNNQPPIADAGSNQRVIEGDIVTLDGNGSTDSDGNITDYTWTWGEDNTTWTGVSQTIEGLIAGEYEFNLTVTDNGGLTATDTVIIKVNARVNEAPVADAGSDQTINLGSDVTLDGNGSTDSDGNITNYSWTDGTTTWTGSNPTISGLTEGTHTITLTVTDDDGATGTDDVVITVTRGENQAPTADSQSVSTDENISVAITLTGSDPENDPLIFTVIDQPTNGTLTGTAPNLTYTPNDGYRGEESFTFKVNDGFDDSEIATVTINVLDPNPPVIHENAEDLCYGESSYSGMMCMDMGMCRGGMGCITSIPINNAGEDTVSDVVVYYDENGMGGSMGGSCNVAPSGTCLEENDIDMGPMGFLGTTTTFEFDDDIAPEDEDGAIETTAMMEMSCLNTDSIYATYVKNGEYYRGVVYPCGTRASIEDVTVVETDEGTSTLTFVVTLSEPSVEGDVTIDYATSDDTALNGSDYYGVSGTIIIPQGETSYSIDVSIIGDVIQEDKYEQFVITMSNPVNTLILDYNATGTIQDNDIPEINEAEEICYEDTTSDTANCRSKGNFYYGYGCTSTVIIGANGQLDNTVTELNISKIYAPDIDNGTCSASTGSCDRVDDFVLDEGPSYRAAYRVPNAGTITNDHNFTMSDTDTYEGNQHQDRVDAIGIYATYMYEGIYHYGRVYNCQGNNEQGVQITTAADAIDTPINASNFEAYNNSHNTSDSDGGLKFIRTMVAGSQRNITGVILDINTNNGEPYIAQTDAPFVIVPYLVNSTSGGACGDYAEVLLDPSGVEIVLEIADGQYSDTKTMVVPNNLKKDARIQLIVVDPNTLSAEGQDCLARSSTTGNLARIGQCANSEGQYTPGFGVDAWDRCGLGNGEPCTPSHGGFSGGGDPTYPGYNPLYDNELGCYMCTFNIKASCSTDNFAIRPDRFDINVTHTDAPDKLRAGELYRTDIIARNADNTIATGYTIQDFQNIIDTPAPNLYLNNTTPWELDTENLLHGTTSAVATNPSYMIQGQSRLSNTTGDSEPILDVTFNDVGRIGMLIADMTWAAVDNDDTRMDCESPFHTYICGEQNLTFIPHHFDVEDMNVTNHNNGSFTYLSNDLNMSAHVEFTISAKNLDNNITQNFHQGSQFYENNITVDLNISEWNSSTPTTRHPKGNRAIVQGIPTESLVEFTKGVRTITWDESNENHKIMFNYVRHNNQVVNPFDVNGTDINVSIVSSYDDIDIVGSGTGNNKVTFYFGRVKPSLTLYETAEENIDTSVSVLLYCDEGYATCQDRGIMALYAQTNESNWWKSWYHQNTSDGKIELATTLSESLTQTTITISSQGENDGINITKGSATAPVIVPVDLVIEDPADTSVTDYTDTWLVYNPESETEVASPFYRVKFRGKSGWAGHGKTGHVVGGNANTEKNRRMEW